MTVTADRVYFHVTTRPHAPRRSWHAIADWQLGRDFAISDVALCGFTHRVGPDHERNDRIPPTAHLCGNCARVIAARTDVEDTGDAGNTLP